MRLLPCLALAALVLAAFQATAGAGATCDRNSDCATSLVCARGRCRVECASSRDCPLDARCLEDPITHVPSCSLAVIDECATGACTAGFVCVNSKCVNACGTVVRCPDGVCVADACVTVRGDAGVPADAGARYRTTSATSPTSPTPSAGGDGGGPMTLACPAGSLMVGYQAVFDTPGASGSIPHALQIVCATLAADGSLGADAIAPGTAGTSSMVTTPTMIARHCAPGAAVVGVEGGVGEYCGGCGMGVFSLGIECAPIGSWVPAGGGLTHGAIDGTYPTPLTSFDARCAAATFIDTVDFLAGIAIDRVTPTCRAVAMF